MNPRVIALLLLALGTAAGCRTRSFDTRLPRAAPAACARIVRPVVAVSDFENQANFSGQWHLGGGMADLLVTQLMDTERVIVLERKNFDDVMSEINRQGHEAFRREGRVGPGRLKNARFLLRGVVTDFTVTSDASGWFGVPNVRAWFGRSVARVSLNIKVVDVETGEILESLRTESSAASGFFGGQVDYKRVSFGGDAFFRTPLGRATEGAMRKAVTQILRQLPTDYWEPRVAEAGPGGVIVNGGENVGLKIGTQFVVRGAGRPITDPITGDVIEIVPGPATGRLRVTAVRAAASTAELIEGVAARGGFLEPPGRGTAEKK